MVGTTNRGDRGAAAVEMALVLPLLLLIVFGLIDFGRMLNAQLTLTEAAREGARATALSTNPADRQARIDAVTANLGTVTPTSFTACSAAPAPGDDAVVELTYTFSFITPVGAIAGLMGGTFGGDIDLKAKGVMPCRA